jgi:hypothetical protein
VVAEKRDGRPNQLKWLRRPLFNGDEKAVEQELPEAAASSVFESAEGLWGSCFSRCSFSRRHSVANKSLRMKGSLDGLFFCA